MTESTEPLELSDFTRHMADTMRLSDAEAQLHERALRNHGGLMLGNDQQPLRNPDGTLRFTRLNVASHERGLLVDVDWSNLNWDMRHASKKMPDASLERILLGDTWPQGVSALNELVHWDARGKPANSNGVIPIDTVYERAASAARFVQALQTRERGLITAFGEERFEELRTAANLPAFQALVTRVAQAGLEFGYDKADSITRCKPPLPRHRPPSRLRETASPYFFSSQPPSRSRVSTVMKLSRIFS